MTEIEAQFHRRLAQLRTEYRKFVDRVPYNKFRKTLYKTMLLADAASAAKLRWKAKHEPLSFPESGASFKRLIEFNPWLGQHLTMTRGIIRERVKLVSRIESDFWHRGKGHDFLEEGVDVTGIKVHRLEMLYRNVLGDVVHTSQQVELADPEISGNIVFGKYISVCIKTSRPTHCAMNGFLARIDWEGWKIIRPKCGYNCLCTMEFITRTEAQQNGWVTKKGKPKFAVKWPNTAAKRNFENGLFPDPGWSGPKAVFT